MKSSILALLGKTQSLVAFLLIASQQMTAAAGPSEVQTTTGCRALVSDSVSNWRYKWSGQCVGGQISGKGKFVEVKDDGSIWTEIAGTAKSGSINGFAKIVYGATPNWYFEGTVENTTRPVVGKRIVRDEYSFEGSFSNGNPGRGTWIFYSDKKPIEVILGTWDGAPNFSGFAIKKRLLVKCAASCKDGEPQGDWYVMVGLWEEGNLVRSCKNERDCWASPAVGSSNSTDRRQCDAQKTTCIAQCGNPSYWNGSKWVESQSWSHCNSTCERIRCN